MERAENILPCLEMILQDRSVRGSEFWKCGFEKLCDSAGAWRRVKYYCWLGISDVARMGRSAEASSCAGEKFFACKPV